MTTSDQHPTLPLPGESAPKPDRPRRRSAWPWIVSGIIVIALAVAAFLLADALVRDLMVKAVREQISKTAGVDASGVQVEVPGLVIPQLAAGTIGTITISADDVSRDAFSGDVVIIAHGVPVRGDGPMADASASVTMTEEQLRTLMSQVDGFPAGSLGIDEPDVTMSTQVSLFGLSFPVGVALTPSAADGDLVLSPAALQLAGADIGADELHDRFGAIADVVLRDWGVCVAQYLPSGLTLASVAVSGDTLVAGFDIAPGMLHDPLLQETGSCT
ncbi:DUF2993 domain-containing protein [Microbacterium sp. BWT-B31]|uniref:DUF2993 domain-containing protein n=1 Tax=Microbacterium sp. BWT-B31 TaxID=3232072 RepID=UPI003528FF48